MSRIDVSTSAVSGIIQLYKYEPFNNTFSVKSAFLASDTLTSTGTSADLIGYISSNVSSTILTFASSNGPNASVSNVDLIVNDLCGTNLMQTLSYKVNIGPGRFLQPLSNTLYTLYRNEPAFYNDPLAPKTFIASIAVSTPFTTFALPTGLSFVGTGTTYDMTGTPVLQSPTKEYDVIGKGATDPSKIVAVKIRLGVAAERLVVDKVGELDVSQMNVGCNITTRSLYGRCPPYPLAGSNIFYSWTPLPDGLYFADKFENPVSSPYLAADVSSTLLLMGAPTMNAARTITEPFVTTVTASRKTLPTISSNVQFSFSFAETVLFEPLGVFSNQYVSASVKLSNYSNQFRAYTRFAAIDTSITTISNITTLPTDLSVTFISNQQYAYVTGTPATTSSGTYTVRASNGNGVYGDTNFTLTVINDIITFTSSDVCAYFVTGRALNNPKIGYYQYPIQFTAVSAAGCNVTYSAVGLPDGITLSTGGVLNGVPSMATPLATYTVTATSVETSSSNTKTFLAEVLAESFTWTPKTLSFVQNIQINPVQFQALTLSDRPVISYSSSNRPYGMVFTSVGKLSGTPLRSGSGTMNVLGTTGLATDTCGFPFTIRQDTIVLYTPQPSYPLVPGQSVSIPVQFVAYSGKTVSNFQFSNLSQTYGLSVNSTTGLISGTVTSNVYYIPDCNTFYVKGFVNDASGLLDSRIVTTDPYRLRYFAGMVGGDGNFECRYSDRVPTDWQASPRIVEASSGGGNDFQIANGVFLTPVASIGRLYRSTNGHLFSNVFGSNIIYPCISAVVNKTGTDTWWGVGVRDIGIDSNRVPVAVLFTSTDNGMTWDSNTAPQISNMISRFQTRDSNTSNSVNISNVTNVQTNAYLRAGAAIAYKNGVLMVGGLSNSEVNQCSVLRSTDFGINWTDVSTAFAKETAFINTDHSNVWVMTGSDAYESGANSDNTFDVDTVTIRYSTDQGATWTAATGGFNMNGFNITYGSNRWLATGLDCLPGRQYTPSARMSIDGSNWTPVFVPTCTPTYRYVPPMPFSPYCYDGSWNTLVYDQGDRSIFLWTHDASINPFDSNGYWDKTNVTTLFNIDSTFTYFTNPAYASPTTPSSVIEFPNVGAGPAILVPESYYTLYQYVTIPPIVFAASDPLTTFYVSTLPIGFAFDPVTNTLTGTPSQLGPVSFQVTAVNIARGITTRTVTFNVVIPRVIRPQIGAGAYTSLVRQYTDVNAAQNSRDKKVLPGEPLGEFMAPPAPDNVSDVICYPSN